MMQKVPEEVELSSLPAFCGDKRIAVISLSGRNEKAVEAWYETFVDFMKERDIEWVEGDRHDDPDLCRSDD
jgi:hypothetical protein